VNEGNAPFRFAPAESTKFFEKFGWTELEFHSQMEDARRLKREMSMMWFWRFLARLRSRAVRAEFERFSGTALMERL